MPAEGCPFTNSYMRSHFFLLSLQNSMCHLSDSNIIEVNDNEKDIKYTKKGDRNVSKSHYELAA